LRRCARPVLRTRSSSALMAGFRLAVTCSGGSAPSTAIPRATRWAGRRVPTRVGMRAAPVPRLHAIGRRRHRLRPSTSRADPGGSPCRCAPPSPARPADRGCDVSMIAVNRSSIDDGVDSDTTAATDPIDHPIQRRELVLPNPRVIVPISETQGRWPSTAGATSTAWRGRQTSTLRLRLRRSPKPGSPF
jgi:hypothetical protein